MRKKRFIIVAVILAAIILTIGFTSCDIGKSGTDVTAIKHTVTFDVNGGNETYSSREYEAGTTLTDLPIPTRDGYEFDCWMDAEGNEYNIGSVMPDRDIALTAKWIKTEVKKYQVTFNLNGGDGEIDSRSYAAGEVMADLPVPSREGYRFICWTDSFGNEYDATSVMPAQDITLRAKWEKVVTSYEDDYVSLKPASKGYKSDYYYDLYKNDVNVFVYVELTSDDLGGIKNVGKENNFTLRTLDGMEYKVNSGYTWTWYQGNFQTPNGAQRFTLDYGSNIQLVTVSDSSGVVVCTYLIDIYVRHDYYINLYTSIYADEPYDTVRVIENDRFASDTDVKELEGFEFDKRVYYNSESREYLPYSYSTAVRSNISLYQTYKTVNVPVVDEEGNALGSVDIKPFEKFQVISSIDKVGYDLIGYRIDDEENGMYFTDVTGSSGINYLGRNDGSLYFDSLTAVYSAKRYYQSYIEDSQTVSVVPAYPVVIYTDETQRYISEIIYAPENNYSVTPEIVPYKDSDSVFKWWSKYYYDDNINEGKAVEYSFSGEVVTKPVAVFANIVTSALNQNEYAISLGHTSQFSQTGTFMMYVPVQSKYVLTVETTGSVTFKVNAYLSQDAKTYTATADSPANVTINYDASGTTLVGGGYVSFTVTSRSGNFEVTLSGPNARENSAAVEMTEENTIVYDEEAILIDPNGREGYAYYCTDESDYRILSYIDKWNYADGQDFVCDFDEYVAQNRTITFDTNGGNVIASIMQTTDSALSLPVPEKEGCVFIGWFTEKVPTSFDSQFALKTMPNKNTTLYAGWASEEIEGKFTYEIKDDEIIVIGYSSGSEIVIPATMFGFPVTAIDDSAFRNCNSIVSVSIPDSIINIGQYAFRDCSSLTIYCEVASKPSDWNSNWNYSNCPVVWDFKNTDVASDGNVYYVDENGIRYVLNDGNATVVRQAQSLRGDVEIPSSISYKDNIYEVTSIGSNAFYNCSSFTSITIPESIKSIGSSAFSGCSLLDAVYVTDIEAWCNVSFDNASSNPLCYAHNLYFNGELVTELKIPDSVTNIGNYAFYNCSSLTSITIPDSVTTIGSYAFSGCSIITANIPINAISVIPKSTLQTVIINSGENIGSSAFSGCSSLTSITIGDSVTSIGEYAFRNCTALTNITIPNSVTSIGSSAFSGCSSLESITLPFIGAKAGVMSNDAYQYPLGYIFGTTSYTGGTKVTQYYYGSSTSSTTYDYYYIPSTLRSVTVTGGNILYGAFYYCSMLTSITIPDSVTSIDSRAFYECSSITSITIPDSVISIGSSAFSYCSSLTSITISASVTSIGSSAFYGCSSLTSITIPDSVTSIGSSAFALCSSLKAVNITDVESWFNLSFSDLTSNPLHYARNLYLKGELVTELVIPDSVTNVGSYALYNCSSLTSITIPDGVTSIGSYALYNCSSLTSITIPDSVTSIGDRAFYNCSSLESVNITDIGAWCNISFGDESSNPLYNTHNLYLNGEFVTELVIPDSVTSISSYAFYNCSMITSITIPVSVTSIGSSAFSGCSSLESITLPFIGARAGVTSSDTYQYPLGYIFGTTSYAGGTSVTQYYYGSSTSYTTSREYYIPSSLRSVTVTGENILYGAFYDCNMLTSITISKSVTSIDSYAFYRCRSLEAVYITDMETWCNISFGNMFSNPLYYAHNLYLNGELVTELVIPDSVKSIGAYSFDGCSSLTSITIPDSVTSIGSSAFRGCSSLESMTLPFIGAKAGVLSSDTYQYPLGYIFGTSSYTGGTSVTQYYYGSSTSYTDSTTYYIPSTLRNVTVTGGNILRGAFYNCNSLTNITIPASVTSIGSSAFYYCSSLTSITIPASVTSIGSSAFYYCSSLTSITIPASVTSIGSYAFSRCSSLTNITIPDSVTSIGSSAFSGCSSLESITLPFIGAEAGVTSSDRYQYPLGYIFGTSSYTGGTDVRQYYYDSSTSYTTYSTYYIPSTLRSVTVTGGDILYGAFYNCSMLTSVTIEDGITSIGTDAFKECSSLTSITIPDSVTSIGSDAFLNCILLTIYCEAVSNPSGWSDNWNPNNCPVVWDCNNTDVASDGNIYYVDENGIRYALNDGNATIVRQTHNLSGDIEIPSSVRYKDNVCEVTSIGADAFYNCSLLTSITIPESVTSIESNAFYGCSSLEAVYITDIEAWCNISFSSADSNPLYYDHNLYLNGELITELIIPDNVTSIGSYAFYNCSSLTSITIPDSVTSIGSDAFLNCILLTIYCEAASNPSGWSDNWNPNNCPVVWDCNNTDVASDGNIYYIDENDIRYALNDGNATVVRQAHNLSGDIEIPSSISYKDNIYKVISIGSSAFSGCSLLTSITIPDSVTSIGSSAFSGCSSLESITLPFIGARAGVTSSDTYQYPLGYIFGTSSYTGGTSVTQYYYGSSTSYTDSTTYYIPSTLRNVTVTGGNILRGAFYNCNSLTNITIPGSVTSIGSSAFYGCSSLTSITIPAGVTSIGSSAFYGCSSLTSITIPSNVRSIGMYAFRGCSSLESVTFGENSQLESIGEDAFSYCSSLTSITIPDSVISIGSSAFSYCSSLTSITIPDSVISIGSSAFYGCSSLTSITIPASVTSIDFSAFEGCSSLNNVTFKNKQGWWRTTSSSATSGTSISSFDLSDPSKAAEYLTNTYSRYYWKRS